MKKCQFKGCIYDAFSHGYCKYHQMHRKDSDWLRRIASDKEKGAVKKKAIPKASKNYAEQLKIYYDRLPSWKEENPVCFVEGCGLPTVDLHHMVGRGIHLNNEKYFMPLCDSHHRICKEDPLLAEKMGLILTKTIVRK